MTKNELKNLILLDGEADLQKELFDKSPVLAIEKFSACFEDEDQKVYKIHEHVELFLFQRFRGFLNGEYKSLDEAFGGKTARQRNKIMTSKKNYDAAFEYYVTHNDTKKLTIEERSHSTPSEAAISEVAEALDVPEETLRSRFKNSKA